ncbi:hypothetical protein M501DRAFT_993444 [Patellaria atrata CBS 101060]|uniref:ER membrane protein complex subunit 2 n=1 Tax=Patellaria atrata CBS 101060 TaxID=1346257 RepID=A0A9P4VWH3_9PEZI|nr:hypothetical protein M501DRAFT_993444 [Patellaria atrata CBS 101060]
MSAELLYPPPQISPADSLRLSQQAPQVLKISVSSSLPYPLSLLTSSETPEIWTTIENLLLSCLRTGDDKSARVCLDRLTERFGETNEKILVLRGMYQEAFAEDNKALEKSLERYDKILEEDSTLMLVRKRRAALLKSMSRPTNAITTLVDLLDVSPTDVEAWAELSELYFAQSLYSQAIYCLEEVLLITPNAWSVHARLGEILYISSPSDSNSLKGLVESMRRFCRSIELCDDYLRGYYGLKVSTKRLLSELQTVSKSALSDPQNGDLAPPSVKTVEKLNEAATRKLAEIVRRSTAGEAGWEGFDPAEVHATRELVNKDTQTIDR